MKFLTLLAIVFFQTLALAECENLNKDLAEKGFAEDLSSPKLSIGRDEKDMSARKANLKLAATKLIKTLTEFTESDACPNPAILFPEAKFTCGSDSWKDKAVQLSQDQASALHEFSSKSMEFILSGYSAANSVYPINDPNKFLDAMDRLPTKIVKFTDKKPGYFRSMSIELDGPKIIRYTYLPTSSPNQKAERTFCDLEIAAKIESNRGPQKYAQ